VPETWMKNEKKQQLLWRSIHIASKVQCVDNDDIHQLNKDGNTSYDYQVISEFFNDHFVSTAEKINNAAVQSNSNPLDYLSQALNSPIPNIKYKCSSTNETKKIIKSLKIKKFTWLWWNLC
jgi:hypothetical protein